MYILANVVIRGENVYILIFTVVEYVQNELTRRNPDDVCKLKLQLNTRNIQILGMTIEILDLVAHYYKTMKKHTY